MSKQSVEVDELLGLTEAKNREEPVAPSENNTEDPSFIKQRVFLNQVDSYHAKYIASYLTDHVCRATKTAGPIQDEMAGEGGEMDEALGMDEEMDTDDKKQKDTGFAYNYEIIGTREYYFHNKSEDILYTVDESNQDQYINEILKCGFLIFDITKNEKEIPKALEALKIIEKELERIRELGPKTFKMYPYIRVFILISTIMTWGTTKPIDPDDPDLPFTEADFKKRKAHPNYLEHIACEREVVLKGRKYKDKLKTYVVCSGITYGGEEEDLSFLFKLAWNNEPYLPVFQPGSNFVPLINIKDLTRIIHGVCEAVPAKQFILAVEQTPCRLKQIIKALSKTMGSGRTRDVATEEAFLYNDMTQKIFDRCTVNLNMEPGFITEELELEWQSELNLAQNMKNIVAEFKNELNLQPIRIIIHGPPAVGKTRLAKKLCEYYGCHYVSVKTMIEEILQNLKDSIEIAKASSGKEEKSKEKEEEEEAEEEEEEEDDEGKLDEWLEQVRDIETTMAESENGKLPDALVIKMIKSFLASNICLNQGYVLDGYPKTIAQAKEIFGSIAEGIDEEEPEEDETGNAGSSILPDYVISLQATDEFLCSRVMLLPENELQGTHYTEEHMLRRLAEFREFNTEDNTVLNFFDELEVHPIVFDVMADESEDMQDVYKPIIKHIGPVKGFPLTAEEELELYLLEQNKQKLIEEEAALMKEMLRQEALEEHETRMEDWTKLLEELQSEEEKLLTVESEPLRNYMVRFIFPTLARALIEVARIKPYDPVDFLAEFLFKENPEGHMFDPSYTRDGERLMEDVEKDMKGLIENITNNTEE